MKNGRSLLFVAGMVLAAPLSAFATDDKPGDCKPNEVWAEFLDHKRCYAHGDKAPDPYTRDDTALNDWASRGLPPPGDNSQWVEISQTYVLINRENSVIKEIRRKDTVRSSSRYPKP